MKKPVVLLVVLVIGLVFVLQTRYANASPYAVDSNTVALYHLDVASQATDAVGNHNGTLVGGAAIVSGGVFGAGGLQISSWGQYVDIGNVHQSPTRDYSLGTVETWVNLSSAPSSMVLLGSGTPFGNSWDDGWYLGRHPGYSNNLVFMVWNGGWILADSGLTPESLVNEWHHIAGTWGPNGLQIWVDGVLKGSNAFLGGPQNPNYATALIGTDSWTWGAPGIYNEVRISDVQRTFSPVPLPASLLLFAPGLAAVAAMRRRFKR